MDGQGAYVHNIKGTPRKKKKKQQKEKQVQRNWEKYLNSHWVYEVRVIRKILGSGHYWFLDLSDGPTDVDFVIPFIKLHNYLEHSSVLFHFMYSLEMF